MEVPDPTPLSDDDAAWAVLLVRGVARLAEALPAEPGPRAYEAQRGYYVYGLDASEDDAAYGAWLAVNAEQQRAKLADVRRQLGRIADPPTVSVVEGDSVEAWNVAALEANGDFLAFVETGDELEPGILDHVALALHDDRSIDVLYTDSDVVTADGGRIRPFFKPGWSPDQLLSHNFVGRLLVVRRSLFEQVGGFAGDAFGSAAEYDFTLRVTDRARRIVRLPIVGYHRRAPECPVDDTAAILALEEALRRRRETGRVRARSLPRDLPRPPARPG